MSQSRTMRVRLIALSILLSGLGSISGQARQVETAPSLEANRDQSSAKPSKISEPKNEDVRRIRQLLEQQQKDWNRGDIEAFMQGYEKTASLLFTSGGKVHRGWDAALRRYRESYPNRDAMGELAFSNLEITLLGESSALVLGKWALTRRNDHPHGVFTLVFRKGTGGWKIIHDHTSSSQ